MGQRFNLSGQQVVGSDGTATATINMSGAGTLEVKRISVNVSTPGTTSSVCRLYRSTVSAGTFLQGTNSGDGDTDTQPELDLDPGETLVAYWTGATVGAVASIRLEGKLGGD